MVDPNVKGDGKHTILFRHEKNHGHGSPFQNRWKPVRSSSPSGYFTASHEQKNAQRKKQKGSALKLDCLCRTPEWQHCLTVFYFF